MIGHDGRSYLEEEGPTVRVGASLQVFQQCFLKTGAKDKVSRDGLGIPRPNVRNAHSYSFGECVLTRPVCNDTQAH